jgi:hypothetical protein
MTDNQNRSNNREKIDDTRDRRIVDMTGRIFAGQGIPKDEKRTIEQVKKCAIAARHIVDNTIEILQQHDKEIENAIKAEKKASRSKK